LSTITHFAALRFREAVPDTALLKAQEELMVVGKISATAQGAEQRCRRFWLFCFTTTLPVLQHEDRRLGCFR
jgi:hypothetical protein